MLSMKMADDQTLVRRARNGDSTAFGRLLRRHDSNLRGVVWSVVKNPTAVDDILQNAYEKAFRSIGDFKGESTLSTWLHSICYRAAIDHIRRERLRTHSDLAVLDDVATAISVSEAALARVDLKAALDMLDPETRSMLLMTAAMGFSYDEVAEITGVARGTVASKVARARSALREELDR